MPSKSADAALRDILHYIDTANEFSAGFTPNTFNADLRTVYALTRCLEMISEAPRRLPDDLKARLLGEYAAYRRKEAQALYDEQGDVERELARQSFELDELPGLGAHLRTDWRRRGLESKLAETAFFDWLARKTWGEPTDGDLLAFTLSQSRAA